VLAVPRTVDFLNPS